MATPRIVVLDGHTLNPGDNPWTAVEELGELTVYERTAPGELLDRARAAEILLTNKTPLRDADIRQLPNLRFISVLATGYNVVDIPAARARSIPVSNVPAYGTDSVAQHVFALILHLCNHVGEHAASVKRGDWSRSPDFCYWENSMCELSGLSLGVVGLGRIGQKVAELGRAFGMNILSVTRSGRKQDGVIYLSMEELFAEADIISLHCSQTAENFQFVNRDLLRRMKPTAFLINTSRGTLINEPDLAEALRENLLAGAALDVLSSEPPDPANVLLHAPRCLITPHVAWSSLSARQRLMRTTAENVRAFLAGQPVNRVDIT